MRVQSKNGGRFFFAAIALAALLQSSSMAFGQVPVPVPAPIDTGAPVPILSADQLNGLVAPIALYPDPLISQILVAATYPIELVEAYQWLQRNPGLAGQEIVQAAQAQNWDPSVQALVVFPDGLKRLTDDIAWTTNLGNAFMAQQADVMGAIQRMRSSAQQSGVLVSTQQQQVINSAAAGQPVIEILPANPQVIYVPVYDPAWIWGPPVYYPYPRWYYPHPHPGLYFSVGISFGNFFGGWGGWTGWGWHPAWHDRTVVVNNTFINRYNFNSARVANGYGMSGWSHDRFRGHEDNAFRSRPMAPPNTRENQQIGRNWPRTFGPAREPSRVQPPVRSFVSPQPSVAAPLPGPDVRQTFRPAPAPHPDYRSFAPARGSMPSFAPPERAMTPFAHHEEPAFHGGGNGRGGNGRSHGDRRHS